MRMSSTHSGMVPAEKMGNFSQRIAFQFDLKNECGGTLQFLSQKHPFLYYQKVVPQSFLKMQGISIKLMTNSKSGSSLAIQSRAQFIQFLQGAFNLQFVPSGSIFLSLIDITHGFVQTPFTNLPPRALALWIISGVIPFLNNYRSLSILRTQAGSRQHSLPPIGHQKHEQAETIAQISNQEIFLIKYNYISKMDQCILRPKEEKENVNKARY